MLTDNSVKWEVFQTSDFVCGRFSLEDWHLAVSDIDSDKEWAELLSENEDYITCYILKNCSDNQPIAFLYTILENEKEKIVSIHGGGWGKSMYLSLLYFRGVTLMLQNLWVQGFRVRTSCTVGNNRAYRFLQSIGFVKYRSTHNYIYMWINEKRLKGSRIYKHICRE